jgi:phosphoglucomutase
MEEVSMSVHPLAGKKAPLESLVNVPRLVADFYTHEPNPDNPAHQVAFGTSGHRGSSSEGSFNEAHILAISQAVCEVRRSNGIDGPLFLGMDTHALSKPALYTAVEVFAANQVETVIQAGLGYTPTPVISHAILTHNQGRRNGLADGVVITPSHNPPNDGGYKYNPPSGGPADTSTTKTIQDRANEILKNGLKDVRRMPVEKALSAPNTTGEIISAYVES